MLQPGYALHCKLEFHRGQRTHGTGKLLAEKQTQIETYSCGRNLLEDTLQERVTSISLRLRDTLYSNVNRGALGSWGKGASRSDWEQGSQERKAQCRPTMWQKGVACVAGPSFGHPASPSSTRQRPQHPPLHSQVSVYPL